jgi:hypothetical protein
MKFTRNNDADTTGTSLRTRLPDISKKDIVAVFGTWNEKGDQFPKYGIPLVVTNEKGEVFTLYSCYGEFRIGGFRSLSESSINALKKLLAGG